jgi:predicted MFS family arabinose efflux permease
MTAASPSLVKTALAGMVAMSVGMGIGRFAYTPILPAMMTGLGLDAAEAGLVASANYAGYLAGAVVAAYGWAAGLERRIAIAALALNVVLLAAMGLVEDVWALSAIRLAAGVVSAFVMIFSAGIVLAHGARAGRQIVQSVHFGGVGVGMAVSALGVGWLTTSGASWMASWYLMGALALAGLVFAIAFLPEPPAEASGAARREPPLSWTPRLAAMTLAYGIFGFGYIVTATFLVAIVRADGGSASFEALVWLCTGVTAAVSVAAGQPFVRRFGLAAVFAGGCVLEAAGVAASVLLPLPYGPLAGGVLLGGTFVMVTAYGLQFGRTLAPQSQRRILAFMTAAFGTGQIIGPLVAGYLSDHTGSYTIASLLAAAALLVSAALAVRAAKP